MVSQPNNCMQFQVEEPYIKRFLVLLIKSLNQMDTVKSLVYYIISSNKKRPYCLLKTYSNIHDVIQK